MAERLHKYLARCGVASRRHAERLIEAGRVRVNGEIVRSLGIRIEPSADRVEVDDKIVEPPLDHVYLALNKPPGVVSTASDPQGRKTVVDLVPIGRRIFPVGRLDYDSEGLLLLTDDGDLAAYLTHPRHEVEKEYLVQVSGHVSREGLERLRRGVMLEGRPTRPVRASVVSRSARGMLLRIVLREGRKRQIRRMVEAIGGKVERLVRVRIGPVRLGRLEPGRWRHLTEEELASLRTAGR